MYYCFRLRGNVPPFTSDGTEALEEHFNAGDYTPEEIENELKALNVNHIYFFQEEQNQ